MYAWYSTAAAALSGAAIYLKNGKPTAVTFVCESKENGDAWIANCNFKDYVYLGPVEQCVQGCDPYIDEYEDRRE
jgi:hypothetical protein